MTRTVRNLRGSSLEPNPTGLKTKQSVNDTQRLLAGRDLSAPLGSSRNPIPPTDSKEYAALQRRYGTKGWLGSL